ANRENAAEEAPDADVLRFALPGNRRVNARVPTIAENCRDRPAGEPGGYGNAACLRSAIASKTRAAPPFVGRSEIRHGSRLYPDKAWRRPHCAPAREQRNQNGDDSFE